MKNMKHQVISALIVKSLLLPDLRHGLLLSYDTSFFS